MLAFIPRTPTKTMVSITKDDFTRSIIKMIAIDGVPLTFFSDEGFQLLDGTPASNLAVSQGRDAICSLVLDAFNQEKQNLVQIINDKPIYVKCDGVTCLCSHFFGVNVQF